MIKTIKIISTIFVIFFIELKSVYPQIVKPKIQSEMRNQQIFDKKTDSDSARQVLAAQPDFTAEMSCLKYEKTFGHGYGEQFKSAKKDDFYRHEAKDYIDYFSPNEPPVRFTFKTKKFEPLTGDVANHLWFESLESSALLAQDKSLKFEFIGRETIDFDINGKTEKRERIKIKVTGKTEVGGDYDKAEGFLYIAPEFENLVVKTELIFPNAGRICTLKNVSFDVPGKLFEQFSELRRKISKTIILPGVEDVLEVAIQPSAVKFFTAESLLEILPRLIPTDKPYRPGRVFQNGTLKLKNGTILNWRAERGFILFYTDIAETVFLLPKINKTISNKSEKMFFRGSINDKNFEMTLVRDGDNVTGSYFYVKSGKASSLTLRGKLDSKGKLVLREFNSANKQVGRFQGELGEDPNDYDLYFNGRWKSNSRKRSEDFYTYGQVIGFTNGWQINSGFISEKSAARRFEIDAAYPQIVGGRASDVREFNLLVKRLIDRPVGKFRRMVMRQTAKDRKNLTYSGNSYEIFTHIKFADERFISVEYFYSESSNGMMHPLNSIETLNYDFNNKRRLKLADLFKPNAEYLETISAYCLKILQNRLPVNGVNLAEGDWAEGAKAVAENYENWNLMKKGLLITFADYQIASYPAGMQSVLIPYEELKNIAKPDGALMKMMQ